MELRRVLLVTSLVFSKRVEEIKAIHFGNELILYFVDLLLSEKIGIL